MKKRIVLTISGLILLVAILGGIKGLQIRQMIAYGSQFVPPPEPVTTTQAEAATWESQLTAVGSLVAVQGVLMTAEVSGKVVKIAFEPGTNVKQGELLVQQDVTLEYAQLRAAEATVNLAQATLKRSRQLLEKNTISAAEYDNADAQYKQAVAQADGIRAAIDKKTIRAPFAGRLGIRLVNLGQNLNQGDAIVSLQSIDPIYVNFSLPQQQLSAVKVGLAVRVTTDALPGEVVEGTISAINPQVDAATRNVGMQATVNNAQEQLRPGMFANVTVVLPTKNEVVMVPTTSILYAPYSDSIFVVEEKPNEGSGKSQTVVRQQFVKLGAEKGDFVAIISGLKAGERVVSTGVFKLRNGQVVTVDDRHRPEASLEPKPEDA